MGVGQVSSEGLSEVYSAEDLSTGDRMSRWENGVGNRHHLTFMNEVEVVEPKSSVFAQAVRFTGEEVGDSDEVWGFDKSSATFEIWLRLNPEESQPGVLLETGGTEVGSGLFLTEAGDVVYSTTPGPIQLKHRLSSKELKDYVQLVAVTDSLNEETCLYVNGKLVETVDQVSGIAGSSSSALGGVGDGEKGRAGGYSRGLPTSNFVGDIALVRIYGKRALSREEVAENYKSTAGVDR